MRIFLSLHINVHLFIMLFVSRVCNHFIFHLWSQCPWTIQSAMHYSISGSTTFWPWWRRGKEQNCEISDINLLHLYLAFRRKWEITGWLQILTFEEYRRNMEVIIADTLFMLR
jgi:hypothetical protein